MMMSSTLFRRAASISGRRLRNNTGDLVQCRAFSSNFNDLEPLEKKENILPVRALDY